MENPQRKHTYIETVRFWDNFETERGLDKAMQHGLTAAILEWRKARDAAEVLLP